MLLFVATPIRMVGYGTQRYVNTYGVPFAEYLYTNALGSAPVPPVFSPLDISNCVLWLDANDSSTIDVNNDLSGANVNRVMKWFDKANPDTQNHYDHDGAPTNSGLYNTHTINGLNVVYFEPNTDMKHHDGGLAFNFQDRTFFAVIKPLTDLSGLDLFFNIYNGFDDTGAMNTGIELSGGVYQYSMCANGIECGITYDLSFNPVNNRMLLMFAQSSTDLSGNVGSFDTISQPLTNNLLAGNYNETQCQYYLNNRNRASAMDIAEIIMYQGVLSPADQIKVSDYLADKWNLSGPSL